MELSIPHLDFVGRDFKVVAPLLGGARVFIDGKAAAKDGRTFIVTDKDGKNRRVRLRPILDIVPKVQIDEEEPIELLPRLRWYELAWAAWPLVLVFMGGAIGGGLGAFAAVVNVRVFRAELSLAGRYALALGIGVVATVLYLVIAGLVAGLAGR